jgi:hypothetical protein
MPQFADRRHKTGWQIRHRGDFNLEKASAPRSLGKSKLSNEFASLGTRQTCRLAHIAGLD